MSTPAGIDDVPVTSRKERMRRGESGYRAYLLRTWTPSSGSGRHVVIQDIETNETRAFADPAGLCAWLEDAGGVDVARSGGETVDENGGATELEAGPR